MRSYVPEARLRVKVSFYKNQMVAVTCGHAYPFVIASWLEYLLSTLIYTISYFPAIEKRPYKPTIMRKLNAPMTCHDNDGGLL